MLERGMPYINCFKWIKKHQDESRWCKSQVFLKIPLVGWLVHIPLNLGIFSKALTRAVDWSISKSNTSTRSKFHEKWLGWLWMREDATPRKTNTSPENQWLEDVFPIEIVPFLGDMLVLGRMLFKFWGLEILQPPGRGSSESWPIECCWHVLKRIFFRRKYWSKKSPDFKGDSENGDSNPPPPFFLKISFFLDIHWFKSWWHFTRSSGTQGRSWSSRKAGFLVTVLVGRRLRVQWASWQIEDLQTFETHWYLITHPMNPPSWYLIIHPMNPPSRKSWKIGNWLRF